MAQWLRNCPSKAIKAQMMKLMGLNIEKLHMDYKIVDRSVDERPYLESEDEDEEDSNTVKATQMFRRYDIPQI